MVRTVVATSIFLLASVVFTFLFKRRVIKYHVSFFILLVQVLLFEIVTFITSAYSIRNHFIINLNTLIYIPFSILLVYQLWNHIKGESKAAKISAILFFVVFLVAWVFENLIFGKITSYNVYLPAIASLVIILVIIHLINQLLFLKNNNLFRDPDGLILMGLLLRYIPNSIFLIFFNFRTHYSDLFYINILFIANIMALFSSILFLMAVLWLPERKKYTLPF